MTSHTLFAALFLASVAPFASHAQSPAPATSLASAPTLAQPQAQGQVQSLPIQGPIQTFHATYQLGSGALSIGSRTLTSAGAIPVADVACFDNTGPLISYGLVVQGEEWVDWGRRSCSSSGIVRQLEIGYATTALDTSLGGPGASLEIALYDGSDLGVLGTEVLRLPLTGLPGSDGTGAFGFTMILTLAPDYVPNAPVLTSEHVGYGYGSPDGLTGPLLIEVDPSAYGPDPFGYEADVIPVAFDDIRTTGQDLVPLTGQFGVATVVPLGFSFDFYGQTLTEIKVATDGYLTTPVGPDTAPASPFDCFPGPYGSAPVVVPFQDKLLLTPSGAGLHVEVKGVAPFRTFIAQWTEGISIFSAGLITFQIKLFESSNAIEFHYFQVPQDFTSAGLQRSLTEALTITCADPSTPNVRFTVGRENPNGTRNLLGRYASPATPASFIQDIVVVDAMGNDIFLASLHMRITEEDGTCATASNTLRFSPANPSVFSSATPPVLGTTWVGLVDTTPWPNATATSVSLGLGVSPCGASGACPTAFGDLLLNPFSFFLTTPAAPVGGVGTHFAPIPLVPSFCGIPVYAQAGVIDPDSTPRLIFTNAIDLVLGL